MAFTMSLAPLGGGGAFPYHDEIGGMHLGTQSAGLNVVFPRHVLLFNNLFVVIVSVRRQIAFLFIPCSNCTDTVLLQRNVFRSNELL